MSLNQTGYRQSDPEVGARALAHIPDRGDHSHHPRAGAIALPPIAGLATALVLGWLFLLGGRSWADRNLRAAQRAGVFGGPLLSAVISLRRRVLAVCRVQPQVSLPLTYVLIAFFLIERHR